MFVFLRSFPTIQTSTVFVLGISNKDISTFVFLGIVTIQYIEELVFGVMNYLNIQSPLKIERCCLHFKGGTALSLRINLYGGTVLLRSSGI